MITPCPNRHGTGQRTLHYAGDAREKSRPKDVHVRCRFCAGKGYSKRQANQHSSAKIGVK